jgi:outer membrane protein assembly factor BamB
MRLDWLGPTPVRADTWPLPRHDHRNTARAPVTVPSDPEVAWQTAARGTGESVGFVVGPDHVFVGTAHLTAVDRRDGTERWQHVGAGGPCALGPDRLYVADTRPMREGSTLRAFDRSGSEQWAVACQRAEHVVPVSSGVVLAYGNGVEAFDADGLSRARGSQSCRGGLALAGDRLYGGATASVSRYTRPTAAEDVLGRFPDDAWTSTAAGFVRGLTVRDGAVLVGCRTETAAIEAFDAADGRHRWQTAPLAGDGYDVRATRPPVVVGDTVVTAAAVESDRDERQWYLVGVDADTGDRQWRQPLDAAVRTTIAGESTVLLGTGSADRTGRLSGSVRAFDTDGTATWHRPLGSTVRRLAVTDGTVFALLADGRTVALRA